jgi:hypothetical protein
MQFFTTEMVFMHPPRTFASHDTSPRRRYGCRTMPRIAVPVVEAQVEPRVEAAASPASTGVDEARALMIHEAA